MEVSSYDALCLMVQAGVGIGILPQGSVGIYKLEGVRTVALDEPWAERELMVCVRSREGLSSAAAVLLGHLVRR